MAIHKLVVQVILIHNHPRDEVEPSESDLDFTDHFIQAGKFLNVRVTDHLIITEKTYYSFKDSDVLTKLKKSKKWVLVYDLEEKAMNKGIKEGKLEEKIEMAKSLKKTKCRSDNNRQSGWIIQKRN